MRKLLAALLAHWGGHDAEEEDAPRLSQRVVSALPKISGQRASSLPSSAQPIHGLRGSGTALGSSGSPALACAPESSAASTVRTTRSARRARGEGGEGRGAHARMVGQRDRWRNGNWVPWVEARRRGSAGARERGSVGAWQRGRDQR